jgi:hydroxypyruvate isomerase
MGVKGAELMTLRLDVNLSVLFTELPLLHRPAAAAACGFTAVEFRWPFRESVPTRQRLRDLAVALQAARVSMVALNFDAGDIASGDRGLISLPSKKGALRENIDVAIEFAEPLGCRAFNALYGNRLGGADPLAQNELAIDNLAYAAAAAEQIGGIVLIETQNAADSPLYPLTRASEAVDLIRQVEEASGTTNVKLLVDLYHLHRSGEDLAGTVASCADRIGHVQIADDPGRHQPGSGEIDFAPAIAALIEVGYQGYLGLEYQPLGPSAESFAWLSEAPWASAVSLQGRQ